MRLGSFVVFGTEALICGVRSAHSVSRGIGEPAIDPLLGPLLDNATPHRVPCGCKSGQRQLLFFHQAGAAEERLSEITHLLL